MDPYAAEPTATPLWTPALVVAVLALLFTVGSFWWIQARRGRLKAFPPLSYAGAFGQGVTLVFPLVLHNTGPAPIVVLDFRLLIDKTEQQHQQTRRDGEADERPLLPLQMSWHAIQMQLEPAGTLRGERHGERHLPSPFPVEGRQAVKQFIEFARRSPALLPLNGPYTATVEVKLGHRPSWRPLLSFALHTELIEADARRPFLVRTNDPEWED